MMNTQWRPDRFTRETTWVRYGVPRVGYYNRRNMYNQKQYPPTITTLKKPIMSVDSMTIIHANEEVEVIASLDWTEGWGEDYYIDYDNGIIEFLRNAPEYRTPVKIEYTYGRLESNYGYATAEGVIETSPAPAEEAITFDAVTVANIYDGKLLKITSGNAADSVYRILTSSVDTPSGQTTLTVLSGYTMLADGVVATDTFEIFVIPHDIQEMISIYAYLGILTADPTYQHNFENPFEDPNPQYAQFQWLAIRFNDLLQQRQSSIQLIN